MPKVGTGPLSESRIVEIAKLVRSWKWKRGGTSAQAFARKWNVTPEYVHDLHAEATRRVHAEVTDPAKVSGDVATALAAIVEENMTITGKGRVQARRLVVDAGKALAQIVGAMAPQRHEVVATAATPAKVSAAMKEAFGPVGPEANSEASDTSNDT